MQINLKYTPATGSAVTADRQTRRVRWQTGLPDHLAREIAGFAYGVRK
ncbi:hypothetical protein [Psychromarinibacter sp. S121]